MIPKIPKISFSVRSAILLLLVLNFFFFSRLLTSCMYSCNSDNPQRKHRLRELLILTRTFSVFHFLPNPSSFLLPLQNGPTTLILSTIAFTQRGVNCMQIKVSMDTPQDTHPGHTEWAGNKWMGEV